MTPPTPQAIEAATKIWERLVMPITKVEPVDVIAALIDRAFAARIKAADEMASYSGHWPNCESADRLPCNCGYDAALAAHCEAHEPQPKTP